jgi:glycosyltransferase involved in cell wall biosynthesis
MNPAKRTGLTLDNARVAIVHDWLETPGGAELVLRELLAVFPRADVFTMIDQRSPNERGLFGKTRITTSWLQHIPAVKRHYRSWLPLMPLALRSLDVSAYDLVISNSHAVAKGIRTHAGQTHICYCLSPMRYAWDLKAQYLREAGLDRGIKGKLASAMLDRMRTWDLANTPGVDVFVTLSQYIAERIDRAYGRGAVVVYPPVDTDFFTPGDAAREDYYVTASRFVPYKRIDMIVEAFRHLADRRLIVIGDGPDEAKIRSAAGPNVELTGRVSRDELRSYVRRAKAFVFAADEDFGIAPVEAQACGVPVIAFGSGGAAETIRGLDDEAPTGVFFNEQTASSLADAIRRFEAIQPPISAARCRENAMRFRAEEFRDGLRTVAELALRDHSQ